MMRSGLAVPWRSWIAGNLESGAAYCRARGPNEMPVRRAVGNSNIFEGQNQPQKIDSNYFE